MKSKYVVLATITLIAVYLLIAVGGIVRSTGSGMGCPDWPKCFGEYIPPTDISKLPPNYKDIYAEKRKRKNLKLLKYVNFFGRDDIAKKLQSDTVYIEEDFNPVKTWIEYINRLLGALVGILLFGTFLYSFSYFKKNPPVFWFTFFALILTGFQGWIGSIVVSTNLLQGMITLHMFLAVLLVMVLIYTIVKAKNIRVDTIIHQKKTIRILVLVALCLVFLQTLLGTQVREAIDGISSMLGESKRDEWVSLLGLRFIVHRSFSWVVLFLVGLLKYFVFKYQILGLLKRYINLIVITTFIQIISGVLMAYMSIPPFLQPIHLLLSVIMQGQLFFVFLYLDKQSELDKQYQFKEKI